MTSRSPATTTAQATVLDQLAAALTEVGLPVHTDARASSAGGVRITAATDGSGLQVSWEVDEFLADDEARTGQRVDVMETMNLALGDVLSILDWDAHPWNDGELQLIVGRRPLRSGARSGVLRG
jgi:hypothetical protein